MKSFARSLSRTLLGRAAMLATASAIALGSGQAVAQTTSTVAPAADQGQEAGENSNEIIVTARKREETLSTVPISAAVLNGDVLEKLAITDLHESQYLVPGLLMDKGNGNENSVTLRGASTPVLGVGVEPSSSLHIDGVYVSRLTSLNSAFLDVERVEVLRGPQGTLYGRNSIGGSINLISKRPTSDPQAYFQAEVGSFEHLELQGIVSGPIVGDRLLGRIAVQQLSEGGYLKNIATGRDYGKIRHLSARGSLLFKLDENKELILRVDYDRQRDHGQAQKGVGVGLDPADRFDLRPLGALEPGGTYELSNDLQNFAHTNVFGTSAQFDWTMDSFGVRSITGFRRDRTRSVTDLDASNVDLGSNRVQTKGSQFTQEFQIFSRGDSALEWIAGAFFFDDRSSFSFNQFLNTSNDPRIGAFTGLLGLLPFVRQPSSDPATWTIVAAEDQTVKTTSYALFANATYNFTPWASLTGGLRYGTEKKRFRGQAASLFIDPVYGPIRLDTTSFPFPVIPTSIDAERDDERLTSKYDNLLPSLTLSLKPVPGILLYGTYSKGFHAGGVNLRLAHSPLEDAAFNPEKATNYEIGAKGNLFRGRLQFSVAAYQLDYTDRQISSVFADPQSGIIRNVTLNGAATRSRGLEAELTVRPVKGLTLTGSAGLIKSIFLKDVRPVDPADPSKGTQVVDVSDQDIELNGIPEKTLSLVANYTTPLSNDLAFDATASWAWRARTPVYTQVGGVSALDPNLANPAYDLVNAQMQIRARDGNWGAGIYAKNLFDQVYYYSLFAGAFAVRREFVAPPREVGIRLFKSF